MYTANVQYIATSCCLILDTKHLKITNIICIEDLSVFNCILLSPHPVVVTVIITGFISSAATLVFTIMIVCLVMQKRPSPKKLAVVTYSPSNHDDDAFAISLREDETLVDVGSNAAYARDNDYDEVSGITQTEEVLEVSSNMVSASSINYTDVSEITPREYEFPEVTNNIAPASANYYDEITERGNIPQVASNVTYSSANNPNTEIDERQYDILELESNVAPSSPNYYADASEIAQRAEIPEVTSQVASGGVNYYADSSEIVPRE